VLVVASTMSIAAVVACDQQVGTGSVPVVSDLDSGPDDALPSNDAAAGSRCGELPIVKLPALCNGDFGSGASDACPAGKGVCAQSGRCISSCDENVCALGAAHAGPACDVVGFAVADEASARHQDARCGIACDAEASACPGGTFCDTGIGQSGGVCIKPLPSGTVFGLSNAQTFASCSGAGAIACTTGKAFGLNETHDFQGWCVCGSPPGAACTNDSECSDLRCNTDKKCGGRAGDVCAPPGPYDIALLPETACRTACSTRTCACEPECASDADCGGPTSGRVCNDRKTCAGGCRGSDGNGCAPPDHCTSTTSAIGLCTDGL
jgi:hypothetical protein